MKEFDRKIDLKVARLLHLKSKKIQLWKEREKEERRGRPVKYVTAHACQRNWTVESVM